MAKQWQIGDKAKVSKDSDVIYTIESIDGFIASLVYEYDGEICNGGQMDTSNLIPVKTRKQYNIVYYKNNEVDSNHTGDIEMLRSQIPEAENLLDHFDLDWIRMSTRSGSVITIAVEEKVES